MLVFLWPPSRHYTEGIMCILSICRPIYRSRGAQNTHDPEFENRGLTLKMHHMFPVHTTPEEFKNTITGQFGRVVEEKTRAGKSIYYRHHFLQALLL